VGYALDKLSNALSGPPLLHMLLQKHPQLLIAEGVWAGGP